MTIQLVQPSQFDAQIQSECFSTNSDGPGLRYRKTYSTYDQHEYSKLYQFESSPEPHKHKNPIYSLILTFILYVIKFYILLKINLTHLYYSICLAVDSWSENDQRRVEHYLSQLKLINAQIPKHVCVITNEELDDRTKISLYCTIVDSLSIYGVETVSFFQLNSTSANVKKCLNDKYLNRDENNNSDKSEQKCVNINFLSIESGGNGIVVSACKSIASRILNKQIDLGEVSQDLVNSQIIELSDMIEPQMVLMIGNEDNLSGFCSWHLRLSEIIKIGSHKLVNRITIRNSLIKYNKIEKRFGK